ncbi:hypothetical protein T01_15667 [Trichinella spiralis]|uniref:Uncharacterized protein n=1 Tax=Trichinella spiralis TaxID=6334 RepID=A0A0V1BI81_TRISP|nr:hypothetical protein T01_15667 [Trichinella spiralis]
MNDGQSMDVRERTSRACAHSTCNRLIRMQLVKTLSSFAQIIEKQQRLLEKTCAENKFWTNANSRNRIGNEEAADEEDTDKLTTTTIK